MSLFLNLLNSAQCFFLKKDHDQFIQSLNCSQEKQKEILFRILKNNALCEYGRKYHFSEIQDLDQFRSTVPIVTYDMIENHIQKMLQGNKNILTCYDVFMFEKTSGSSSASKYIPFTRQLLKEIHLGTAAWIFDTYNKFPSLKNTKSYWSISPKLGQQEFTSAGLPIGFSDDTEYFSFFERLFMRFILAVSPRISSLAPEAFREETAKELLTSSDLGLISIWNPSFLEILLEHIERKSFDNKIPDYKKIWPKLEVISLWTDGNAKIFLNSLKTRFPHVSFQGKGLMMTEGIITIPFSKFSFPILSINSHFYEFIDEDGNLYLPYELQKDKLYIPVLTTSGGLYRYKTGDFVKVQGHYKGVPLLSFEGRADKVCDLCGEKLNENFISQLFEEFCRSFEISPLFMLLAPVLSPQTHYGLFLECEMKIEIQNISDYFETKLFQNHHYAHCRKIGQLGPVKIYPIKSGKSLYEMGLSLRCKQKIGNIKPASLDKNTFWPEIFKL